MNQGDFWHAPAGDICDAIDQAYAASMGELGNLFGHALAFRLLAIIRIEMALA